MAADLSPSNSAAAFASPKSHRQTPLPSPWALVVRGGDMEAVAPSTTSSSSLPESRSTDNKPPHQDKPSSAAVAAAKEVLPECSDSANDNVSVVSKKSPWIKPVNGVVVESVVPLMGATWPTISESTRPLPQSSSDSVKQQPLYDGLILSSKGPVASNASQKQPHTNGNTNFTNHTQPVRHRSSKRVGSAGGGSGQSGFTRPLAPPPPSPPPPPPPPPPFPAVHFGLVPQMEPPRDPPFKSNNWEIRPVGGVGLHSHAGNDHSLQRHSSRRGNFGSRLRGDGAHHNGFGGRRDQDRNWVAPRSSTARGIHMHQMAPPPGTFMRTAVPGATTFIPPQHVRPYGNPLALDMIPQYFYGPPFLQESLRPVPYIAQSLQQAVLVPPVDPDLRAKLVIQIDYYFSNDNLVKDNYLRSKMDDQGWVHISLIANFRRVENLTTDVKLILDALGASTVVEVQGDKVRRRDDWRDWVPLSGLVPSDTSLPSPSQSTVQMLAASIQEVSLNEVSTNKSTSINMESAHSEVIPSKSSSEATTD